MYSLLFVNNDIILAGAKDGLYYTLNGGQEWLFSELNEELNKKYRLSYALASDNSNNIYSAPYKLGVYKSDFKCKDWVESINGFSAMPAKDIICQGDEIYISCWGVFKSFDSGKSFKYLDLKSYDVGPLNINSKGVLFAGISNYGTYDGFFRSKDAGKTWENTNNLMLVKGIALNSKDHLFVAPGYRSTNDGDTWLDFGIDANFIAVNDEDHVFAFGYGDIYRSIDDGVTWDKIAETEVDPSYIETGGRVLFNNKTKTAAYYDMMTTDNGRTSFKQRDLGYSFGTTSTENFAVDSTYNWVFAGSKILKSTDNGKSWQRMDTTGLKHSKYTLPAVSPDGHVYVFGATGGLYRSRDKFVSVEEQMKLDYNPNELLSSDIYEIEVREWELFGRDRTIKIYNTLGKCVLTDTFERDLEIQGGIKQVNISALPPGVYFIRYLWAKKSFVKY